MKKTVLFLLSGLLIAAAIQIVPCAKGVSNLSCCQKSVEANIANPYTNCCQQERNTSPAFTLNQNLPQDFQAAGVLFVADASFSGPSPIFYSVRFHWPGQPKSPIYLAHLNLLL